MLGYDPLDANHVVSAGRGAWMVAFVDLNAEEVLTVFHQEATSDERGRLLDATSVDSRGIRGRWTEADGNEISGTPGRAGRTPSA